MADYWSTDSNNLKIERQTGTTLSSAKKVHVTATFDSTLTVTNIIEIEVQGCDFTNCASCDPSDLVLSSSLSTIVKDTITN